LEFPFILKVVEDFQEAFNQPQYTPPRLEIPEEYKYKEMVQTLMTILPNVSEKEAWQFTEVRYYEVLGIHNLKIMQQESRDKMKMPADL